MGNIFFISLLTFLFITAGGGSAYSETPPPDSQQSVPADGSTPQAEVPKQVSIITVQDSSLSVELVNADFGETIHSIAKKAGFTIEGSSEVFSAKLTTKFNNLDIDRGFVRLFSLVKESNYLISYDSKGSISKVEIYGSSPAGIVKPPTTSTASPARPQIRRAFPTSPRIRSPRIPRPVTQPAPSEQPQTPQPPQPSPEDQTTEEVEDTARQDSPPEEVKEIPYIPPQKKPVYIPSMRPGKE